MENKTTIELLELLHKEPKEGEKGYDEYWASEDTYEQLMEELRTRSPFNDILNPDYEDSLPAVWEAIKEIQEDIKQLKRHKHEEKSGDVMIRI